MITHTLVMIICLSLWYQHVQGEMVDESSNAVCFDLEADGRDPHHNQSGCRIYVMNNGHTTNELGIEDRHWNDCIEMNNPSASDYTYVWTTCHDALWIDEMQVLIGNCGSGRRKLDVAKEITPRRRLFWWFALTVAAEVIFEAALTAAIGAATDEIASHGVNFGRGRCQNYGVDNARGWCLSLDQNDWRGWGSYHVPARSCFQMFQLGRPAHGENNVWGYQWTFGRRLLANEVQDSIQAVLDCEALGGDCNKYANKVFDLMGVEKQENWVNLDEDNNVVRVEEIRDVLSQFDSNKDRRLDFQEFEAMIKEAMEENGTRFSKDEDVKKTFDVKKSFGALDKNDNGYLDIHELSDFITKRYNKKHASSKALDKGGNSGQ